MNGWRVRQEGTDQEIQLAGAVQALEGLRDGDWEATDEVRGPGEKAWLSFEEHPLFAEAVAELTPPPPEPADETTLDMNPLIDVALVLLIFIILSLTASSLRRTIDIPSELSEDKGPSKQVTTDQIKDRIFRVKLRIEDRAPVLIVEQKKVDIKDVEKEIKEIIRTTGRKEMFVEVADDVPWGVEAKLYDAAKAANVLQIYWPKPKK